MMRISIKSKLAISIKHVYHACFVLCLHVITWKGPGFDLKKKDLGHLCLQCKRSKKSFKSYNSITSLITFPHLQRITRGWLRLWWLTIRNKVDRGWGNQAERGGLRTTTGEYGKLQQNKPQTEPRGTRNTSYQQNKHMKLKSENGASQIGTKQ